MTVRFTGIKAIPPNKIRPNKANPRKDMGDVDELAVSLRTQGVLQPLIVFPIKNTDDEYELIDGQRRHEAATRAGLPAVPCLITDDQSKSTAQVMTMLAAAMHKQLTPLEQCDAFQELLETGLKIKDIAAQTGYSTATIRDRLRLSALPAEAKTMLADKQLNLGQATDLAKQVSRPTRSGSTSTGTKKAHPFRSSHTLATRAHEMCTHTETSVLLGEVACGNCWEAAIREDERNGYDVDDLLIARALSGDPTVRLNPRELYTAIHTLLDRGTMTAPDIAKHLGTTPRQVERAKTTRTKALTTAS